MTRTAPGHCRDSTPSHCSCRAGTTVHQWSTQLDDLGEPHGGLVTGPPRRISARRPARSRRNRDPALRRLTPPPPLTRSDNPTHTVTQGTSPCPKSSRPKPSCPQPPPLPSKRRTIAEVTRRLSDGAAAVAVASMHAMGSGALADFESLYTADAVNREADDRAAGHPGPGPGRVLRDGSVAAVRLRRPRVPGPRRRRSRATWSSSTTRCRVARSAPWCPSDDDGAVAGAFFPPRGPARFALDPDPLVPHRRRPGHRALGQPRRPRHGPATGLEPSHAPVPAPDAARHPRCSRSQLRRPSTDPCTQRLD